ncbi:MAG: nucleoside phosphorylase [Bacteroidetes bacterium]|nr:nucleoside phosphorylase [Bacteroidota bacterium]MBU1578649.1 nucleoside phosphorylase [Bacteroidota bacterium]MBU2466655.1 nucleoside phosphorylase [Bacteroidota bacterium]MBU2558360.1 nucleoside phosphorylase [Bacteroidota bacterium]
MKRIPESQLVLAADGSIYHLRLKPNQLADDIILVGDPNRVALVSSFFDSIEHQVSSRELVTHTGIYKGKRISAISTGMGTDNIDIVINELDALVNIDLETRTIKKERRSLNLIRLGTSGALQADIPVGESFVAGEYALGLDGLIHFYAGADQIIEHEFTQAFIDQTNWPASLPSPYIVKASETLLKKLATGYNSGTIATSAGFYAPQGRSLRLGLAQPSMNHAIENFKFNDHRITNFEMESSALYGLSRLMGHNALTICVIIANRVTEKFSGNYQPFMKKLIQQTLDRLVA